MNKILLALFVLCQVLFADPGYYENRILFCLKKEMPDLEIRIENGIAQTGDVELNRILEKYRVTGLGKWLSSAKEQDVVGEVDLRKVYRAQLETKKDWNQLQTAISEFTAASIVLSADLEGRHKLAAQTEAYVPSDTRFDEQWYLTKIMADYAWGFWDTTSETPGDPNILVGVVDTGVDYEHPEMENILYWNLGEDVNDDGVITAADENNIDDDGNGYIDDFRGWDFAGPTQDAGRNPDNDIRPPQSGPYDELSHGTHVSGIIAATSDNETGIASISFESKVIATKNAYDDDLEQVGIVDGYDAILYCAQMGAKFINCSWGGPFLSSYERSILDDVSDNYGAIVVGACGNEDSDNDGLGHYPSDYSKCISVAATTTTDSKTSYSNYGSAIDISAPAGENYSSSTSTLSTIHYNSGEYDSWPGTSMASPMVAGTFALLNAYFPDAERQWLIDAVLAAADTIDHLNPSYVGELGTGRLNTYKAIAQQLYPSLLLQSWSYTIINDDGDGQLNPGEQAYLLLTIENEEHWTEALSVNVSLSSTDENISFPDNNTNIGDIIPGTSASTGNSDLIFEISSDANLEAIPIDISITANQSSDYPYESVEQIEVVPTMFQAGFPISDLVISTPVAVDSILEDGDKEIFAIAENDSLYMFDADGSLVSGFPVYLEGQTTAAPVIADMDSDGTKEIVVVNRDALIKIVEPDGTILLSTLIDETFRGDFTVGNMDTDTDLEIVFGTYSKLLHIINIDGSEKAGFPIEYTERIREGIALADLDGDDAQEIIFATDEFLHVINSSGTEWTNFPVEFANRINTAPIVSEVDNTFNIVVSTIDETVSIVSLAGTVTGSYTAATDLNKAPGLADIDNDDFLEIVFGTSDGQLHAIEFSGISLTAFPVQLESEINTSPVFSNFNNDDSLEIVVSTSAGYIHVLNFEGNNYANYPAKFTYNVDGSSTISDLDKDGDFEIISGSDQGLIAIDDKGQKGSGTWWQTYLSNNHRNGHFIFDPIQSSVTKSGVSPAEFHLAQNYPNPFNPTTTITYQLKEAGNTRLTVYAVDGSLVKKLVSESQPAGTFNATWDAMNESGQRVSSGVYFYKLITDNYVKTRKMILLR